MATTSGERSGAPSASPPKARRSTLLSDALVRSLIAAGQADVLVAIPTLNHAETVGRVARVVVQAFTGPFARQRTVLLNPDGGSTDGTRESMLQSGAASGELVVTSYPLRTVHRITAPYHGVPGRGNAVALAFAAADLLGARAVAIVDPEATELGADDLARFLRPILDDAVDFVKPVVPRNPEDGPLVTQLVRPLMRACFGKGLLEPVDTMLGCSGKFATRALAEDLWETPFSQYGLDPWLCALAVSGRSRIAQVAVPPHAARRSAAEFGEVFQQIVGSVFGLLARDPESWLNLQKSEDIAISGRVVPAVPGVQVFDAGDYAEAYRQGIDALKPMLSAIVRAEVLDELVGAAQEEVVRLDDAVWARTVYDFVAATVHEVMPRDQLVQCLQPVYLGRVCSWLNEVVGMARPAGEARLEALARAFEELKAEALHRFAPTRKEQG